MRKGLTFWLSALVMTCWPEFGLAQGAGEVDLSPATWPAGDLQKYSELNQSFRRRPLAEAENGMVVGTTGALAVRAGLEALKQGGTAMDAVLVTSLAEVTLAAGSWVSFAGLMTAIHYEASSGRIRYIDGEFTTVLGEDDPLSIPSIGGRTAMVPGFMAGVAKAHRKYGALPWESLFAPAVYFAEEGFTLDSSLAATIQFRSDVLGGRPETRAIFFKPNGSPYKAGDQFRQPELAETLRRVARQGADYMYTGKWGDRLVVALQAEGGKMTRQDLQKYRALFKKAKKGRYRGYVVHGPGRPGDGGALAVKAFRKLGKIKLARQGHYTESAETLFDLMKTTRDSYTAVPPLNHSDGVVAIDQWGNVAAALHSINTLAWGETGIFVDGVSIPDAAVRQQHRVEAAGLGKRIWSGTMPLIVTRKGVPVLASSAIGNGLFEASVQSVINVLDFQMNPKEAVDSPIFRSPQRSSDSVSTWPVRVTRREFSSALIDAVRAKGMSILELSATNFEGRGYWIGLTFDPRSGRIAGATANTFNGLAEGY